MVCHINNAKVIEVHKIDSNSRYLIEPRYHVESFIPYAPVVRTWRKICFLLPFDRFHIPIPVVLLSSVNNRTVKIADTNTLLDPIINPDYPDTEVDRTSLRIRLRTKMRDIEMLEANLLSLVRLYYSETPR